MTERLSIDEVRQVAKLARLRLSDEQLQRYRDQLSTILDHIAKLSEVDVQDVEPMAHPGDLTNRLDEDVVGESLPVETILAMAPAIEAGFGFIAVPKVLIDQEQA